MKESTSRKPPAEEQHPRSNGALEQLERDPSSRKRFLKVVGGAAAAGSLATLLAACGEEENETAAPAQKAPGRPPTNQFGRGDIGILNYALTLEHLEAEFYEEVVRSGEVTDRKLATLAKRIGENENEHVEALTATVKQLGGTPAKKPKTNFRSVIEGGPKKILATAAVVENVGAAAYLGQAGNIKSDEVLAAALSIHTVEAEHAAALNELAGNGFRKGGLEGSLPDGAFAKPMSVQQVLAQVKPFLAA
ncbi:MAG: ferritin-like domain-containing protein [Actinomycetota bacterium]|nr:ferritin-like domain-containing protein [Actinomycetota bacterium]